MSSHLYYNRAGMSYLDRSFAQRHWSLRPFYRGKHRVPLLTRLQMLWFSALLALTPIIKAVLWAVDTPNKLTKQWKRVIDFAAIVSLIITLVFLSM